AVRRALDNADDFRYDVAAALDENTIVDGEAEAADLVFIVKRGVANRGAAKLNRLEHGYWRQRARAADLDADIHEPRRRLARRELHGNGPSRRFRSAAQLRLQIDGIHLHDDAVDFVIEIVAMLFPVPVEIEHL